MDRKFAYRRLDLLLPLLLGAFVLGAPLKLAAQVPIDEYGEPLEALDPWDYTEPADQEIQPLNTAELEELVGPIALYPDDLLAIVLPASTYPLEIVQAARFLDELATDSSLEPDESWDESVIALLNYPEVVYMMDKEIDWTWRLGEAVINQQTDVLAAVESFRDRAYAAGNLESDERQTVSREDGVIEIAPVDEEIIYVPYYEPEEVLVYQPRRVYYYYPHAYPVYYYPYPLGYSFASGYFWGVTTAFTIGWPNHYLHVYHPSYWGHPYYGRHYYAHYYRHPSISVYNHWYVHNSYRSERHRHRDGDHWRPRIRSGARPETQTVRNRYYSAGGSDNDRRSGRRTRQNIQDGNRERINANNNASSRSGSGANPSRRAASDRLERGDATDFRARNRTDADRVRANRSGNSDRNNPSRRSGRTDNNSSRQRLIAENSRQTVTSSRANPSRQVRQRNVAPRQTTATRTSTRNAGSERRTAQRSTSRPSVQRQAATQRQASRPSVQRQAPAQRPASRPSVQRQAPAQRSAPAVAPQRQSGARRQTSAPHRGQPRGRQKRQN